MSEEVTVVIAAIVNDFGEVLLQKRGPTRELPGQWENPGGRVEEGETHQAALARELHEELGLETVHIEAAPFLMARMGPPIIFQHTALYAYRVRVKGTPHIREDQQGLDFHVVKRSSGQTPFSQLITEYLLVEVGAR